MGQPITWQNVNGASLSDAFQPMAGAARSMNGAFDGLQNVLKERQSVDNANWEQQKSNNTSAYLAKLALLGKTPDALQAAMATGELDQMQQGFGAQVDQKQTLGAADRILEGARKQEREASAFQAYRRSEAEKPIDADGRSIIASGNTDLFDAWAKEGGNAGISTIAELHTLNTAMKRANIQAKYADNEEGRRKRDQELQELNAADQRRTNAAQREAAAAQRDAAKEARVDARTDKSEARADKLMFQLGKLREDDAAINSEYAGSAQGMKTLTELADKLPTEKLKVVARQSIVEAAKLPGMTVASLSAGLNAMQDTDWTYTTDSTYNKRFMDAAKAHIKSDDASSEATARAERSKKITELERAVRAKLGLGRNDSRE